MEDTETKPEEGAESTPEKTESAPSKLPYVDEARAERIKLEKVRDDMRKENDRLEALKAREMVGGITEGGQAPKKETEEEKYNREAKERYEGTGLDPTPDDTPTTYG